MIWRRNRQTDYRCGVLKVGIVDNCFGLSFKLSSAAGERKDVARSVCIVGEILPCQHPFGRPEWIRTHEWAAAKVGGVRFRIYEAEAYARGFVVKARGNVTVIPSGSFGTTLGTNLTRNGLVITLFETKVRGASSISFSPFVHEIAIPDYFLCNV